MLLAVVFVLLSFVCSGVDGIDEEAASAFLKKGTSSHTNHWAIIVDTSRFWFNYRHAANALSMYRTVKRLGIPDSNIILMLADDAACNPRNVNPGMVNNDPSNSIDLYGDSVEIDYRGYEVSVENFLRVLTGRHEEGTPRSKRLASDAGSNIFIYMTGHGGEEFLKFQDAEEISSMDLSDAFTQMWQKKRYNEIFFMTDTCQAATLNRKLHSPNILFVGSSKLGQNSYSFAIDRVTGVPVIDRFTYSVLQVLERVYSDSQWTIQDLKDRLDPRFIMSEPDWRTDLFKRPLSQIGAPHADLSNMTQTQAVKQRTNHQYWDGIMEYAKASSQPNAIEHASSSAFLHFRSSTVVETALAAGLVLLLFIVIHNVAKSS